MYDVDPHPVTEPHNRRYRPPAPSGSRPDRVALWAFVMAVTAMLAAAVTAHGAAGGVGDPTTTKTGVCASAQFGERNLSLGDCGADVKTLNWILNSKSYGTPAPLGKTFATSTKGSVQTFQRKAGLRKSGVVNKTTRESLVGSMRKDGASWYGRGFYGDDTACGVKLTRRTVGVAHRSLPCGTRVTLRYKGRYLRTRVIDRGPYARGLKWDLTNGARKKIGLDYTDVVRSAIVR